MGGGGSEGRVDAELGRQLAVGETQGLRAPRAGIEVVDQRLAQLEVGAGDRVQRALPRVVTADVVAGEGVLEAVRPHLEGEVPQARPIVAQHLAVPGAKEGQSAVVEAPGRRGGVADRHLHLAEVPHVQSGVALQPGVVEGHRPLHILQRGGAVDGSEGVECVGCVGRPTGAPVFEGDGHQGVLAPVCEHRAHLVDHGPHPFVGEPLEQEDLGAADGLGAAVLLEDAVGARQQLPPGAVAAGPDQHAIWPQGEDRGEADAELVELGAVILLGRCVQRQQLVVDGRLVHAAAVVLHADREQAGLVVDPHVDAGASGVDAVLGQLPQEV